jgi:hypothetical protein
VSCPVAAGSGVIDADGVASEVPEVEEAPAAPEVAGAAVTEADGAGAAADDELADEEDEHPATVRSTPVIAASTAAARWSPRTTKADTELPIPDLDADS